MNHFHRYVQQAAASVGDAIEDLAGKGS